MTSRGAMKDIWMYWEGAAMPAYIRLCVETIERHRGGLKLNLLDQRSVRTFLPDLRPEWDALQKPAHKADYVRTRLALKYGGMWIDCDIAALGGLEPLFDFPDRHDYACQSIAESIGCFIARPDCELLRKVTEAQDRVLDEDPRSFGWNGIGNDLLRRFGEGYAHHRWTEWTLDSIADGKVSKLLSTAQDLAGNLDPNARLFHFCNEATGPLLKRYFRDSRLLTSNALISKIFRAALAGDPRIGEPDDGIVERFLDRVTPIVRRAGLR